MPPTIAEVGERALIARIRALLPPGSPGPLAPLDDAFAFPVAPGHTLVANTDMLVGRTDVPAAMSAFQAGAKSVVMNVSDLAVKGVTPSAIVVSLGLPPAWPVSRVEALVRGILHRCAEDALQYLGGDVNETGDLIVSPTVFGVTNPANLLPRDGARPGDVVAVNGEFGLTGLGFQHLLHEMPVAPVGLRERAIAAVLEPRTRLLDGPTLARAHLATASIDSSDGLSVTLHELARASGVGVEVDASAVPVPAALRAMAQEADLGCPLADLAFHGGEEFVHLFTVGSPDWPAAQRAVEAVGGQLHAIGRITAAREEVVVREGDGSCHALEERGWEHWRRSA